MAAKGHKQYEYSTKALTQITREHTGKIEYLAEASVETGKELDTFIGNFDISMSCTGMGSTFRPLLATPKQDLIGNGKVEADWMKDVQQLQADLDRDHNTFLQSRI